MLTRIEKVLIVEDELLIADHISRILSSEGFIHNEYVTSVDAAIQLIETNKPDLVITDISLGVNRSGIDLGQLLHDQFQIPFIYITSHSGADYISKVKNTFPSAYLVKPFKKEDLLVALELALHKITAQADKAQAQLTIKDGHSIIKIPMHEIICLESDRNYTLIHTINQRKKVVRIALTELLTDLPSDIFLRVHRSFIVNINCVTSFNSTQVYLKEIAAPIGRTYKDEAFEKLGRN